MGTNGSRRTGLISPLTRRRLLSEAGTLTAAFVLATELPDFAVGQAGTDADLPADPFTLGVASGDPLPGGVVIWTRLTPEPQNGGFRSSRHFVVQWEVAADSGFKKIVRKGAAAASPESAHSVHVEVDGLEPGRSYWYRFLLGKYTSRVGRTRTTPAAGSEVRRLRFAFCSCADFQNGEFAVYRSIAEEPDLDFVLHLGDYLYEYGPSEGAVRPERRHTTPAAGEAATQLTTLDDYRARHAQYKTDPHLQAAHAAHPFILTWDDHETENNYAGDRDESSDTTRSDAAAFRLQRAAAYQAYYEHMPIRRATLPRGADALLYRRLRFGKLLEINVLDTRQYRTAQPLSEGALARQDFSTALPADQNPMGTLLGGTQEKWLLAGWTASAARWNVLAQQVMMARFNFYPKENGGPNLFNLDQWDGYGAARQRLLDFWARNPARNFVVLTGDIHSAWAHDLKKNFDEPSSATVATEFVCTSITAGFPALFIPPVTRAAASTPWTRFFDALSRGYTVCTVTPERWQTDFRAVTTVGGRVTDPAAPVTTIATRYVENGKPGAVS